MDKKVSVIIPCYNQGEYIEETINSVLNQTYDNIEIIIIDDGSNDLNTIKILSNIENKYQIKVERTKNQGLAMARNNGIRISKGEYILPLDSDDKIHETYIEKAVEILKDNKIGAVYSIAEFFGEKQGIWALKDFSYDKMLDENVVFCSAIFRKSDYDKTNGYNLNMKDGLEDWDFWLSLIEIGVKFKRIDEILFFYRFKEKSMLRNLKNKQINMRTQIFKNHINLYEKKINDNFEKKYIQNEKLIYKIIGRIKYKIQFYKLKKLTINNEKNFKS